MEKAREARRRRIVERGSDRLAFITGQVRTIPPSPSIPDQQSNPQTQVQDQSNVALCSDDATGSLLPKSKTSGEEEVRNSTGVDTKVVEQLAPSLLQPPPNPVVETEPFVTEIEPPWLCHSRIFNATTLNLSIAASENIRLLCSITVALLVILTCRSDSTLGGCIVKMLIFSRPLYLVVLTDITIVVGLLLLRNQGGGENIAKETRKGSSEDDGWVGIAGMVLEAGLVFKKAMGAIFMDCSVCAVIIISGLSLLH